MMGLDIERYFTLPFPPHGYQVTAVEELLKRDCSLLKFKVGLGKTATATLTALQYSITDDIEQIWIICPPILLDQWYEFLLQIGGIPDICLYRGTPKERAQLNIGMSVVLVSYNIFRDQDYKKFKKMADNSKLCIIADELSLKSLKSQTYRKLKQILYRKMRVKDGDRPFHKLIALNATPLSDPEQVYNWCSIMEPGLYLSKKLFEVAHVAKEDHWGKVIEWRQGELLADNMARISVDTDQTVEVPELVETVVPYSLSKAHLKLYKEVKRAKLDELPEDKIELVLNSLFSALQKLVLLPSEFGLDIRPPILDFIEGYLDQIPEDEGVIIYTRHVAVSEFLHEAIDGSVAIYGGVSTDARTEAFNLLRTGGARVLVGNLDSLGKGLNLQILNHIIYAELPFRDDVRVQSTGRLHRQGQTRTCTANYPLAKGTLQEQIFERLLQNAEDIDKILKTKADVRQFLD